MVLEKTLESPLDCKEIQPDRSEGDQPWDVIGRTVCVWTGLGRTLWAVIGRPQSPDFSQKGGAEAHVGDGTWEEL